MKVPQHTKKRYNRVSFLNLECTKGSNNDANADDFNSIDNGTKLRQTTMQLRNQTHYKLR